MYLFFLSPASSSITTKSIFTQKAYQKSVRFINQDIPLMPIQPTFALAHPELFRHSLFYAKRDFGYNECRLNVNKILS